MEEPNYDRLVPIFARMRDFLARAAPPGRLPGRQHISPAALREFLPFVNLVDVLRTGIGLRFRYRLVGTTQTAMLGREVTGRFVEDAVLAEFVDRVRSSMRTAVERKRAIYDRFSMPHPDRTEIDSECVYFPLAADGATIDMLLVLYHYPGNYALSGDPWAS